MLRKGDCSSCTASPWRSVPSKTGSPVVLAKSARTNTSLSVSSLARVRCCQRKTPPTVRMSKAKAAIPYFSRGLWLWRVAIGLAWVCKRARSLFGSAISGAASVLRTSGRRNRYPRFGMVSMYRGSSALSSNASLSLRTATLRLPSKSTKVSPGQRRLRSSSRLTISPGFSRRARRSR